jgi:hypothetical protein
MLLDFDEWLSYGVENGYCTQQFCQTHGHTEMTDYEEEQFDEGYDPCVHVVRLGTPKDWLNP